jgi:small subunit ribosomal protein S4
VDGKKVDIPSYRTKPGQVVSLTNRGMKIELIKGQEVDRKVPKWLQKKGPVGKIVRLPEREEIGAEIDEHLIVEYYSR